MGEFRIGRTRASHSYPERRSGSGGDPTVFARNFASGPDPNMTIETDPGTSIIWSVIDVGTAPDEDVPITPLSTGIVRVHAAIAVKNGGASQVGVQAVVEVDGGPVTGLHPGVPATAGVQIPADGAAMIPILTEITGLTVGVEYAVSIRLIASAPESITLTDESSTMELHEVIAATG